MKFFTIVSALAVLLLHPIAAQASTEPNGHITTYLLISGGKMFFTTDGSRENMPGCATAENRWVFDDTTPSGQALVAGMLTAYALHKTLTIVGSGDCGQWVDTETAAYFYVF